jgi:hypothetical protein
MSEVIYVAGLAAMLGKTESSIREGLRRGVPWLPGSFKIAGQHAWLKDDAIGFLRGLADGVPVRQSRPEPVQKVRPGRKRRVYSDS